MRVMLESDDDEVYQQIMIPAEGYEFRHLVGAIRQLMNEDWEFLQLDAIYEGANSAAARFVWFCMDAGSGPMKYVDPPLMVGIAVEEDKMLG